MGLPRLATIGFTYGLGHNSKKREITKVEEFVSLELSFTRKCE